MLFYALKVQDSGDAPGGWVCLCAVSIGLPRLERFKLDGPNLDPTYLLTYFCFSHGNFLTRFVCSLKIGTIWTWTRL